MNIQNIDLYINDYLLLLEQNLKIIQSRLEHRVSISDYHEYENYFLINSLINAYLSLTLLLEKKENKFKDNFSDVFTRFFNIFFLLGNFPESVERMIQIFISKYFSSINRKSHILVLTSFYIQACSININGPKDHFFKTLKSAFIQKNELVSKHYFTNFVNYRDSYFEGFLEYCIYTESKQLYSARKIFINCLMNIGDFKFNLFLFQIFDKRLKNTYDDLKNEDNVENQVSIF